VRLKELKIQYSDEIFGAGGFGAVFLATDADATVITAEAKLPHNSIWTLRKHYDRIRNTCQRTIRATYSLVFCKCTYEKYLILDAVAGMVMEKN
jgi:hypothetical protein